MPEEDVSDLREVVDAINKLCDTMKTSSYEQPIEEEINEVASDSVQDTVTHVVEEIRENIEWRGQEYTDLVQVRDMAVISEVVDEVQIQTQYREEMVSPEIFQRCHVSERWCDSVSQISLPGQVEDVETVTSDPAQCDPVSEMFYTASSEVSLLSDTEQEKVFEDVSKEEKRCVIAGHVAAMRERFESMTRTNTPCPDLARSLSPSLEVFRNTSPSPDRLA